MGGAQTVLLSDYIMPLVAIKGLTGQSRAGCCESVSGLAGGVRGNWVGEARRCYGT